MSTALLIARMTTRQVLGLRRFIGLALLAVAPAAIMALASGGGGSSLDVLAGGAVGLLFPLVLPIVALIPATSALGDEKRDSTLPFIALRPLSRTTLAAAKVGGAVASAALVATTGTLAYGVLMGLRTGDWGHVLPLVVGGLVTVLAYAGPFVALGYVAERATLIGLVYVTIWESAIVGAVPALAPTSPWRIGFSAYAGMAPDDVGPFIPDFALGTVTPGAGGAVLKALVIVIVGVAIVRWMLTRLDLA